MKHPNDKVKICPHERTSCIGCHYHRGFLGLPASCKMNYIRLYDSPSESMKQGKIKEPKSKW